MFPSLFLGVLLSGRPNHHRQSDKGFMYGDHKSRYTMHTCGDNARREVSGTLRQH